MHFRQTRNQKAISSINDGRPNWDRYRVNVTDRRYFVIDNNDGLLRNHDITVHGHNVDVNDNRRSGQTAFDCRQSEDKRSEEFR